MPFSDVIGHSRLAGWLAHDVAASTVGPAYLFLGPAGVGKRFLAQQFAQALQCPAPVRGEACARCPMCRLVEEGKHPDVLVVAVLAGGRQIVIEQIRQLQRWLSLTPFHGRRKVVIVDDADTMQEAAASALLKTLEEPPPTATLLLIAVAENRLLPTIVSRCARLPCGPLPTDQLLQALAAHGVEPSRAAAVARQAGGRLGRARHLADEEVWTRQQAGVDAWLAAVQAGEVELSLAARPRAEVEEWLESVALWYHDLLLAQTGADPALFTYPHRQREFQTHAARSTPEQTLHALEAVYATRTLVQQRVNARTAVAALITRLAPDPRGGR